MKVGEVYLIKLDEADEKWTSISEILDPKNIKVKDICKIRDNENVISELLEWEIGDITEFNFTFTLLYDKNPGLEQIMDDHPELFI